MRSMAIVARKRNGAVRVILLYSAPSDGMPCVRRRRTLTVDIHVIGSSRAKWCTRQAIIIPKTASCAPDDLHFEG